MEKLIENVDVFFADENTSPVNIVATATVVTDGALLDEEDVEEGIGEVESEGTEKSANEEDEEVDVDVEECSSVEDGPVGMVDDLSNRKYETKNGAEDRKHRRRTTCNSDELRDVECHLETKELWDKFNDLGTEMIITKTGRCVFDAKNCLIKIFN